jgi:glycosyltransferase involved in cell wall biosynthesis
LVSRLLAALPALAREFEIVLVNDASPDDSWRVIQELAAVHPAVRGIDLMRNYGQHNALLCGIRSARHALVATLDDDLQNRRKTSARCSRRSLPTSTWSTACRGGAGTALRGGSLRGPPSSRSPMPWARAPPIG